MIHPSPEKLRALADRWIGQEARLQRIAASILAGEDWTRAPARPPLRRRDPAARGRGVRPRPARRGPAPRYLHPPVEVTRATERDAGARRVGHARGDAQQHAAPRREPVPRRRRVGRGRHARDAPRGPLPPRARRHAASSARVRWAVRTRVRRAHRRSPLRGDLRARRVAVAHRRVGIGATLLASAEWDIAARGPRPGRSCARRSSWASSPGTSRAATRCAACASSRTPRRPTFLDAVLTKRLAVIGRRSGAARPRGRANACDAALPGDDPDGDRQPFDVDAEPVPPRPAGHLLEGVVALERRREPVVDDLRALAPRRAREAASRCRSARRA